MKRLGKAKTGYMCAVDYEWLIDGSWTGASVYPSFEQLQALRPCVKGCGSVRVKIVLDKEL